MVVIPAVTNYAVLASGTSMWGLVVKGYSFGATNSVIAPSKAMTELPDASG